MTPVPDRANITDHRDARPGCKLVVLMRVPIAIVVAPTLAAVMFLTGANDPRVAPWHMMKMAARTQAATSSGKPVLLRIEYDAGHGMGSNRSQREVQLADTWSFALWQVGDPDFQPK